MIAAANTLAASCSSAEPLDALAAKAEVSFAEILDQQSSEPTTLAKVFAEVTNYIESRGAIGGLQTGFNAVDALTGGLEPGQLVIVAARPAMGKTVFGCNVANHVASNGGAVPVFGCRHHPSSVPNNRPRSDPSPWCASSAAPAP